MTNRSGRIKLTPFYLLLACILLLVTFARIWEFGALPPGLNQDEASSGVDAFSPYCFGVDRNGVSYPVHFISWGSGQNALYAYLLIPFIALGGLTPVTVRLPMVLSGILTLPLVCFVAKRTLGEKFALISTFLVAISPWHILLSRWGLESNLLPFVFLLGYACLLKSARDNRWFIAANLFALFSEQTNPELYLKGMEYVHPTEPFRKVRSVGRFTFGLQGDAHDCRTIYILGEEKPPCANFNYKILPFDNYRLYLPQTGA